MMKKTLRRKLTIGLLALAASGAIAGIAVAATNTPSRANGSVITSSMTASPPNAAAIETQAVTGPAANASSANGRVITTATYANASDLPPSAAPAMNEASHLSSGSTAAK